VLQFDGGSRGNPGLSGSGAVLLGSNVSSGISTEIWNCYNFLGEKLTNNVAEYDGLLTGVTGVVRLNIQSIEIQGDSELIIKQLTGLYQVKSNHLIPYYKRVKKLLSKISSIHFKHIPRELNERADYLSNVAMDSRTSKNTLLHPNLIAFNRVIGAPQSVGSTAPAVEATHQVEGSTAPAVEATHQVEEGCSSSTASSLPLQVVGKLHEDPIQQQLKHHFELIKQLQAQSECHSDMISESSTKMTSLDQRLDSLQSASALVKRSRKSKPID